MKKKFLCILAITGLVLGISAQAEAFSRGIYLTQSTEENSAQLTNLIAKAKKYNLDTFIVDLNIPTKRYDANIAKITSSGIHYVARIVIFPHGGTHMQVTDKAIWNKKLALAKHAVKLGATAIQLDYIRYRAEFPANPEKAKNVLTVVKYFKNELRSDKVSLQMDIFGISAHRPAHTIGQDPQLLAQAVDAFCPMVYPSHFEPYREYAVKPYETVFDAVKSLRSRLAEKPPVSIYAYIELFNYRYKMSHEARLRYIEAQMKAAHDSGASGWYIWSANYYTPLFEVLASNKSL
jgi:hypothetical protein